MSRIAPLGLALVLASCSHPEARRDLSEPVTAEDLEPLPGNVTPENARLVIRRCLQAHRQSGRETDRRFGYAFRPEGIVQLCRSWKPADEGREREVRAAVDYAAIRDAVSETFFDLPLLRERARVTIRGAFRRWESIVTPYRALPPLGQEPAAVETDSIEIVLDDADAAGKLAAALRIVSRR